MTLSNIVVKHKDRLILTLSGLRRCCHQNQSPKATGNLMTYESDLRNAIRITNAKKSENRFTVMDNGAKKHLSPKQVIRLAYEYAGDTCCCCHEQCNPILSNYIDFKGLYCDMCV